MVTSNSSGSLVVQIARGVRIIRIVRVARLFRLVLRTLIQKNVYKAGVRNYSFCMFIFVLPDMFDIWKISNSTIVSHTNEQQSSKVGKLLADLINQKVIVIILVLYYDRLIINIIFTPKNITEKNHFNQFILTNICAPFKSNNFCQEQRQ